MAVADPKSFSLPLPSSRGNLSIQEVPAHLGRVKVQAVYAPPAGGAEPGRPVIIPRLGLTVRPSRLDDARSRVEARLDEVSGTLSALEIEDLVTVRDVTSVLQLMEMVRRISADIDSYVLELGTDGRLLALQVEELTRGLLAEHGFLLEDYLPEGLDTTTVDARLKWVGSPALLDLAMVARSMGLGGIDGQDLDAQVSPRGLRILSKIPRLPVVTARAVVEQWGSLQGVLGATIEELEAVEGVGAQRARTLRDGLSRLAEISVVERYS